MIYQVPGRDIRRCANTITVAVSQDSDKHINSPCLEEAHIAGDKLVRRNGQSRHDMVGITLRAGETVECDRGKHEGRQ